MAASQRFAALTSALSKPVFQPVLTGPLLYILLNGPDSARAPLIKAIQLLPASVTVERVVTALKWLVALGAWGKINTWMNNWALNQWQLRTDKSKWNFKKEVAVVTGGSSGIGAVIVKKLMQSGVKVAVLDVQPLPEALQNYADVAFFQCDVTNASEVHETGAAVRKKFGSPSILVNNAGIGSQRTIIKLTDAQLHKIFGVNIMSHFTMVKEFIPDMIERNKGHIVTIASMASFMAVPGIADYSATKAGVLAFHEALNQEIKHIYKAPGIKTTVVHPNWVSTPLVAPFEEAIRKGQGPLLTAEDVGGQVVSQILSCCGGQLIIPSYLTRVSGIRAWPNWLQEAVRDTIGKVAGT